MMKTYQYWEMEADVADNNFSVLVTRDEVEILDEHWDHWCERVQKIFPDFRKDEMDFRAKSECIDDFLVLNWAWEKK